MTPTQPNNEFAKWSGWFILSLFLLFGTIGLTYNGLTRLRFWLHFGDQPMIQSINILKTNNTYSDGYVAVTGKVGKMVSANFGPYNAQDLSTVENYYFPLMGNEKLIHYVVEHPSTRSGKLWFYPGQTTPEQPILGTTTTITGVAGWYLGDIPNEATDALIGEGYHIARDAKLLKMNAIPPTRVTLLWYLIPFLTTIAGIFLFIYSMRKLRPYVL